MSNGNQDKTTGSGSVSVAMIDSAGWGLFFIWVGVALLADIGWGLALFGVGVILLGGQAARSLLALKADWWSVAIGVCLAAAGLVLWLDISLGSLSIRSWLVPGFFVVVGVTILVSIWMRRHHG